MEPSTPGMYLRNARGIYGKIENNGVDWARQLVAKERGQRARSHLLSQNPENGDAEDPEDRMGE